MRMESDEFDFLPPAYVRGFLKSYARFLGVDPAPLLEDFDRRFGTGPVQTAELVALQRRGQRKPPRATARSSRWAVAAIVAGGLFLVLFVVGLVLGPDQQGAGDRVANEQPAAGPRPRQDASPSPSPKRKRARPEQALALENGINVEIIAVYDRCWIDVTADGENVFSQTLERGDSQTFEAERKMTIVFGYPSGVELIVNGRHLGSPASGPNPATVTLPDDIRTLL